MSPPADTASGDPVPMLPPLRPRWRLSPPPEAVAVRALAAALNLPEALCRLLAVRGLDRPEPTKAFLRPLLDGLHPSEEMTDAPRAAARLSRAIDAGERILVHGDYDVDGISGTALLTGWIRRLGGDCEAFVPNRSHGYDLSEVGVRRALAVGARVLVTVDCGIRAHDWVSRASAAGVDVIVTDHHSPAATLPPALAVVNPNRPDCGYPNKDLCGAGVAFKLCQLLARGVGVSDEELWTQLDLVALATVADQVPLVGENRVLVRYGLKALERTERPGLVALARGAGLRPTLDATSVAFGLAPRINAAGRIGETDGALRLLMTGDPDEAASLASVLEKDNRERRKLDRQTLQEALSLLAPRFDPDRDRGLVIAGDRWHPGVIGIVASRVVERVHRPAVVVALDGDRGRGSARSIPGFHLYEAIADCGEHLERFGGHRQAAGMDVTRARLGGFEEAFQAAASNRLEDGDLHPVVDADMEIRLDEIPGDFFRWLRYAGPFGQGNPEPVFVSRGVYLESPPREVGQGHLKFRMVQDGARFDAIGFGLKGQVPAEVLGTGPVDVAYTLGENTYRGLTTVQAQALDVRPAA